MSDGKTKQLHESTVDALSTDAPICPTLPLVDDETLEHERVAMRQLFAAISESLGQRMLPSGGAKDDVMDLDDMALRDVDAMVRWWAGRWLRVFQRRQVLEGMFLQESLRARERAQERERLRAAAEAEKIIMGGG